MNLANIDNLAYHYVCRNPVLFKEVDKDFFNNTYIKGIFELTKNFYSDFGKIPFVPASPFPEQLIEIGKNEITNLKLDHEKSIEENLRLLISTIEIVIEFEFTRHDIQWTRQIVEGWIAWQKFQKAQKKAIEYQKSVKVTADNVLDVINTSKNIISNGASVIFDTDDGVSFMDPEAHKQVLPSDLYKCKNNVINQWKGGGFEPGTLTHLWGASNVGKSIFLINFALDFFTLGYNVLFVSLEMATHKLVKRAASNAFNVSMDKYSDLSNNEVWVKGQLEEFRQGLMSSLTIPGNLWLKRFSHATVGDMKAYAQKKSDELGIQWHIVVIDYLGEIANAHGISASDMYMYHKTTNDDLFRWCVDDKVSGLTAHQLKAAFYGVDDYTLSACGESTGIIHRTDDVIGIMQTAEMKANKQYKLKYLKARDSGFKDYHTLVNIDYDHMRITPVHDYNMAPNYF